MDEWILTPVLDNSTNEQDRAGEQTSQGNSEESPVIRLENVAAIPWGQIARRAEAQLAFDF